MFLVNKKFNEAFQGVYFLENTLKKRSVTVHIHSHPPIQRSLITSMEIEYYWCKEIFVNNNLRFNSHIYLC